MVPETVTNARYAEGEWPKGWGYPQALLLVDLDGVTVAIWEGDQLLTDWGGVTLQAPPGNPDSSHYMTYKFIQPADPEGGRSVRRHFDGTTGDPRVMGIYRQYLYDVRNDGFRPGTRIL